MGNILLSILSTYFSFFYWSSSECIQTNTKVNKLHHLEASTVLFKLSRQRLLQSLYLLSRLTFWPCRLRNRKISFVILSSDAARHEEIHWAEHFANLCMTILLAFSSSED